MATFTAEEVLALVAAARRDDDGVGNGDGGAGGSGPGGGPTPTPTMDDVPEPVLAAARALSEDSGCTVTCTSTPGGGIVCVITDCPEPIDPDEKSELEDVLLKRLVEEAGKANRSIRFQRDRDERKPNDPVERLDKRLAVQEAAAAAFGDLLREALPSDLAQASKDACLSIATRLAAVSGKDKLESAMRQFAGAGASTGWTPEQVARELSTLSAYLKSWVAGVAEGVLKGADLPQLDREFWTAIRDAARAGR